MTESKKFSFDLALTVAVEGTAELRSNRVPRYNFPSQAESSIFLMIFCQPAEPKKPQCYKNADGRNKYFSLVGKFKKELFILQRL